MDDATRTTRDGWEQHFIDAMENLSIARGEFTRAERHLEPLLKARISRFCKRLDKTIKRGQAVFDAVQSIRDGS